MKGRVFNPPFLCLKYEEGRILICNFKKRALPLYKPLVALALGGCMVLVVNLEAETLSDLEVLISETRTRVAEVFLKMGISDATFNNLEKKYGGFGVCGI